MGFFRSIWNRITSSGKTIFGPRSAFFWRGFTKVDEDSSMQVAAFHRGVIYISTQIAKLPWEIKDKDYNSLYGSTISNLLDLAPNSEMNAFTFRLMMLQQAIIHGNSYAEIERNLVGQPVAIWPLRSQDMEILRTDTGKLVYRYSQQDGPVVYLNPNDVFHIKNFHTKDGIVGQGVVAYGREVLGIQLAADTMASGIFHNGGIPSGVLTHPGRLSDEAYARLKTSWKEEQGGRKAGGTSILEEGVKYEPINTDPEALQFLQSRQFGVLEMARFLGVPPTKLYDVTAATYSNQEQSNLEVATDTLDSWAKNFEMEADIKLLNYRYGNRFSKIDLYSIFRGDMKTRSDYFKSMVSIGTLTPNQVREWEGMAPYKEGDNYYIATNNFTPVNRMDELIDADIAQKTKPNAAPANNNPPAKNAELEDAAIKYLTSAK